MYFKVTKGTPVYDKLIALRAEMTRCNDEALKLVKEMGYTSFRIAWHSISGGISAIRIETGRPNGWRFAYKKHDGEGKFAFLPAATKKNLPIIERMKALPTVSEDDFNSIIDYDWGRDCENACAVAFHPGLYVKDGVVALHFSDMSNLYKPVDGLVSITEEEYDSLK